MNPKLISVLRSIALIWLPAAGTLVLTVSAVWGLKDSQQIVNTIMAVDAFLGAGLGLANKAGQGFDGHLVVNTTADKDRYVFRVNTPLDKLPKRNEVRLKVMPDPKATTFTVAAATATTQTQPATQQQPAPTDA